MNFISALKKLSVAFATVVRWCSEVSSVIIIVMMFLITSDVVGRYLFNSPIPGTTEMIEVAVVFVVFLAYAYTEASGQHIRIQIIEKYLKPKQLYILNIFAYLAGMFVYGIICWKGWGQAMFALSINERMAGWFRFSVFPGKIVLVWGSFILVLQFFVGLVQNANKILKG